MTSQLQIHPFALLCLELDSASISALTPGKTLGFGRRGRWKDPVRPELEEMTFLFSDVEPMVGSQERPGYVHRSSLPASLVAGASSKFLPHKGTIHSCDSHALSSKFLSSSFLFTLPQPRVVAILTVAISATLRNHSIFLSRYLLLVNNLYIFFVQIAKMVLSPGCSLSETPWNMEKR